MPTTEHPSQSVLTIDLGAIAANYTTLRDRLTAGGGCAAVVKANAYGLGIEQVGPALARAGCTEFFVVYLQEGLILKPLLPSAANVYVLNGVFAGEEADLQRAGLIPALNDLGQTRLWMAAARKAGRRLPCILHVDTGMTRLGLSSSEIHALSGDPALRDALDLRYVISHLACSEEPDHPLNAQQLTEFRRARTAFPGIRGSLANSSGVFLGPDYQADLVRPGVALFGVNPLPGRPNPMRAVARLDGKVLQIHEVDPPKTVGYGATHRVIGRTRVATVAVGYADGWPRTLSNRGSGYIGDVRVPLIGRVSMDLTTFNVTAVPHLQPGDTIELIGPHQTIDEVAETAGTIAYELLTRFGSRYHRVYTGA